MADSQGKKIYAYVPKPKDVIVLDEVNMIDKENTLVFMFLYKYLCRHINRFDDQIADCYSYINHNNPFTLLKTDVLYARVDYRYSGKYECSLPKMICDSNLDDNDDDDDDSEHNDK
jgi:hypothetical protein